MKIKLLIYLLSVLPDPVTDPIVAMNISNVEFDYTYDGGEEALDVDN